MVYIYLNKLTLPERVRVNPDEIRMIEPLVVGGSMVIFRNDDCMKYKETPRQIEYKEWNARYVWPNLEKIIIGILSGAVGSMLTLLLKHS